MVKDIIFTTKKNLAKNNINSLRDIYNTRKPIVTFSPKMKNFDNKIKNFLRAKMYYHKDVKLNTNKGREIIKSLFIQIRKKPERYLNVSKYSNSSIERSICDFIAGMTDRYAINLYDKFK